MALEHPAEEPHADHTRHVAKWIRGCWIRASGAHIAVLLSLASLRSRPCVCRPEGSQLVFLGVP